MTTNQTSAVVNICATNDMIHDKVCTQLQKTPVSDHKYQTTAHLVNYTKTDSLIDLIDKDPDNLQAMLNKE